MLKLHRLRQEIFGPAAHRLDGEWNVAVRGDHDDDTLIGLEPLEQIEALHVRKLEIEQDEVGSYPETCLEPVVARVRAHNLVSRTLEEGAEGCREIDFVVDDDDRCHATAAPPSRGAPLPPRVRTA